MNYKHLFRTEDEVMSNMPIMTLAHVIMGFALAWIYSKGVNRENWLGQGLRFGVAAALLAIVPWYLIHYSVEPWSRAVVTKLILFDSISLIVVALATAYVYRSTAEI